MISPGQLSRRARRTDVARFGQRLPDPSVLGSGTGQAYPYTTTSAPSNVAYANTGMLTVQSVTPIATTSVSPSPPPPDQVGMAKRALSEAQDELRKAEKQLKNAQSRARVMDQETWIELVTDAAMAAGAARSRLSQAQAAYRAALSGPPARAEPVRDVPGRDLRPDPTSAQTAGEFLTALRDYRIWSGEPSYRRMAAQSQQAVSYSTLRSALIGRAMPSMEVVLAIVAGCGGGEDVQRRFATAWRQLQMPAADSSADRPRASGPLRVVARA